MDVVRAIGVEYTTTPTGTVGVQELGPTQLPQGEAVLVGYSLSVDFAGLQIGPRKSPQIAGAAGTAGTFYPCRCAIRQGDFLQATTTAPNAVITLFLMEKT